MKIKKETKMKTNQPLTFAQMAAYEVKIKKETKMKPKTATQVALEKTRQELKDIKAAGKRAAVDLKKATATLRYEIKTLRTNVKTDNTNFKIARKAAAAKIKAEKKDARVLKANQRAANKALKADARLQKAATRAAAKAARIDAIQAKLDALKNPIGIHAKKAAKKPSKVTIVNPAAALIAVMNKKAA